LPFNLNITNSRPRSIHNILSAAIPSSVGKCIPSTDADELIKKGCLEAGEGKFEEAIRFFDQAIEERPFTVEAWSGKANALMKLGRYVDAIVCYEKCIELKPDWEEFWDAKGRALAAGGKSEEAITCYEKAIEINYEYAQAWSDKGNALATFGQKDAAAECERMAENIRKGRTERPSVVSRPPVDPRPPKKKKSLWPWS
jgi:tetratricopeptide (TPR) repeat protein